MVVNIGGQGENEQKQKLLILLELLNLLKLLNLLELLNFMKWLNLLRLLNFLKLVNFLKLHYFIKLLYLLLVWLVGRGHHHSPLKQYLLTNVASVCARNFRQSTGSVLKLMAGLSLGFIV